MAADRVSAEFSRSLFELLLVGSILVLGVVLLDWSAFDALFLAWADAALFVVLAAVSLLVGLGSPVGRLMKFFVFLVIAPIAAFFVTGLLIVFFTQPDAWADGEVSLRTEDFQQIAEWIMPLPVAVAVGLGLWTVGLYARRLIIVPEDGVSDRSKSLVGHAVVRWVALFVAGVLMAEWIDVVNNELLVVLALVFGRLVGLVCREIYTPQIWRRRIPPHRRPVDRPPTVQVD